MNDKYRRFLQRRIASTSVGASTARNMGPKGTVRAARLALQSVDLRRFRVRTNAAFLRELNIATRDVRDALPGKARHWGSARKFLNIFLRGCFYNRYLCEHYRLHSLEEWLEVPLDSQVAKALRKAAAGRTKLPVWEAVIRLSPKQSEAFQTFASVVARDEGVSRVHLDLRFWRSESA